jgi:photosystem II stability/assembly factor-like uncharacterized protein
MYKVVGGWLLSGVVVVGGAAAAVDPDLLAGMKARSIGPAGMSGRIAAIDAVVADPDVVYAGAATGGLWKSANGGLTWKPVFDEEKVAAIGAVAIFQPNPDVVWVGTGEGNLRNSASVGWGVYRSLDGGEHWQHLGLEKTERIHRIRLHPTDPDVAWVCAPGQEWGENPDRGVFRTRDGGATWEKVLYVDERTGCGDLALDPTNPDKLFAGMWQFRRWPYFFRSGGPGSGLHVSRDGGTTWTKLQEEDGLPVGDLGRIGVAVAPSDPQVVYALVEAAKSALLRSSDGGRSFTAVNTEINVAPRPFYFADLRVDPEQPNRIYSLDYNIRVSDDGGKSFENLTDWGQIHGDNHALWIHPEDPSLMYLGDDGGFRVSRDGGATVFFSATLPVAQFYHIAVDNAVPYRVMGGMQDNSSWRGPSSVWEQGGIRSHQWQLVGWGDGYDVQPDPELPEVVYSMWQGGNLQRWNTATGEVRDIKPPAPEGVELRFNWNSALALDPFAPGTLYYGSQFVHKSTDRGETWTIVSPDLTSNNPDWQRQGASGGLTPDVTAAENHTTLLAIAPSPVEPGVIWAGSDDGRVHVTRDGGATWESVEARMRGVPANTWVPHIEASPHHGGTAFVVFDDHRRANWTPYVYRTDDYGRSWRNLATADLWGYALVLEQDPVEEELLFLGTEFGLWVSTDAGASWMRWKHGLPTVSVMDLAIQAREHDLVIGTHGRAAYVLDDVRPLRALAQVEGKRLHLFEPPPAQQYSERPEPGGFGLGSGEFRGENRPYGALLTYWLDFPELPLPDEDAEKERKERERAAERAAATWGPEGLPEPAAGEAEEEEEEEKPKAKLEVADASGAVIRTWEEPAVRGINRAAWGLRRDAFKLPPPGPQEERDDHPAGPEVPPGHYTVTVSYAGESASAPVEVRPDPRSPNTPEDWQRRWEAILAVGAVQDALVEAIERVREARDDVTALLERSADDDEEDGEADGGDPVATPEGEEEADDPLATAGKGVEKGLDELERRLWQAPETTKGIVAEEDAWSQLLYPRFYFQGSWAPPSPSQMAYFEAAKQRVEAALAEVNAFFDADVAEFRRLADERGLRLLPPVEALALPAGVSP